MRLQRMLLLAVVLVLFPLASVDTGLAAAEPATGLSGNTEVFATGLVYPRGLT